jgi:hypothetical protein
MKSIAIINGSPKANRSTSGMFAAKMKDILAAIESGCEVTEYQASELAAPHQDAAISDILGAGAILFIFPLYIDSLPAPLIRVLEAIEKAGASDAGTGGDVAGRTAESNEAVEQAGCGRKAGEEKQSPKVYAICNCGFYEAEQTRFALDILENFSIRTGLAWGYGIGVGCGASMQALGSNMEKGGAAKNVYKALYELCETICQGNGKKQNIFVTPKIPRFIYKQSGHQGWYKAAKKYGKQNDLVAKPYEKK